VLPFDTAAYADIFAARRRAGRPISPLDLMIAAVARANGAYVVTRHIGGFEDCGVHLSIRGRLYLEGAAAGRTRPPGKCMRGSGSGKGCARGIHHAKQWHWIMFGKHPS